MTIKNELTMRCSKTGCNKSVTVEGANVGRRELLEKAQGWQFVNAQEQYCPEHRASAAKASANGKGKGKEAKGKKSKTLKSSARKGKGPKVVEFTG